jgi:CPA2 family monovalent cation:H+ antiporter-2
MGYARALGAFVAGALVAESGSTWRIKPLVLPIRDLFVAIFFVSVGMSIDPQAIAENWLLVVVFTSVVIVGKMGGVTLGAFLMGHGVRTSMAAGMSLAQIGELSFVVAGIGVALAAIPESLYSVAIAVSALTTFFTPWFIRISSPVAALVDRRLPHALQTFASLYGTWLEKLRSAPRQARRSSAILRCVRMLMLDASLVLGIVVGATLGRDRILDALQGRAGLGPGAGRVLLALAMGLLALPFCVGIVRLAQRLGLQLGLLALPAAPEGKLDLAAAPRRALVVTLQIAIVLFVGLPLVLVMQPFVNGLVTMALLLALVLVLGFVFRRSAADLQGHVHAGAELIAEALLSHARAAGAPSEKALVEIDSLLPGMGTPVLVQLEPQSAAVGRTLAEINLRGRTGATVLALARGERALLPGPDDTLAASDVLALTGTQEAIDAATTLLRAR